MHQTAKIPVGIKIIIGFHLINIILWLIGQTGAVIAYDTVAELGLQGPRELLDPAIVEVNRGIGLTDTITLIPLFIIAVIGLTRLKFYGIVTSWMALGITVYWPVVAWSSNYFYLQAGVKYKPFDFATDAILAFIVLLAAWASWYLFNNRKLFK